MLIHVKYIPLLFDESTWVSFESHNETVYSIIYSLFQKHPEVRNDPINITVRVNGKALNPFLWKKRLNDGDEILIIQEIGYESLLVVIASLGISGAGISGAALTLGAVVSAWATVIIAVASIAYTIYSYATASHAPKTGGGLNSSPTYGWDGLQMQARQGIPVPIVYGEHLLGGNLIEAYISSDDDKNYLNLLVAVSEGPIEGIMKEDLSGVCTASTENIVYAVGTITMSGIAIADETFNIDYKTFTWKATRSGVGEVTIGATAAEACTNIIAAVNADIPLSVTAAQGAGTTVTITAEKQGAIYFAEFSTNMAMDMAGGQPNLGGTVARVDQDNPYILINDNLLSNYKNVSWYYRTGTHDQTQITDFGDVCQTYSTASVKITTTAYTYTTTDLDVEGFELRFRIPTIYSVRKGEFGTLQRSAHIEYRVHGAGGWTDAGDFSVTTMSQTPVRRFFRVDNLAAAQYDIRITGFSSAEERWWMTDEQESAGNMAGAIYLDNVIEIKYDTLTYPLTALVAVRVLATEQLSGQLPNVLTRIRGRKVLNLNTSVIEWTNNPIYCVNDLMVNSRYGTGNYITQSNVNNDQLILMAAHCDEMVGSGGINCKLCDGVYDSCTATSLTDDDHTFLAADIGKTICVKHPTDTTVFTKMVITSVSSTIAYGTGGWSGGTPTDKDWEWGEKRYELDLVIDSQNPAFDTINQICGCFRASPIWSKDAIQLLIDKKESPSYIFTMGNIIDGSFQHTFQSEKNKPNSIQIDYADKSKKYQKETVDVIDYAAITGGIPIRPRRMSLLGASRQTQIYREGRFHLYAPKYQDEQITFKGGIDAIHMLPGDVAKFQHDVFQWGYGGRVVLATTTAVTLDQSVTIGAGTYVITCKLADDSLETRTISDAAGIYTTVNVTVAFTAAPPVFGLYAVGLTGVEAKPFRIMSVLKTPENEIEVVATEYSDSVYADTDIVIADPVYSSLPPNSTWPSEPDEPDATAVPPDVTGFDVTETTDKTGVSITFVRPATTTNWYKGKIYISRDGGTNYEYVTTMYDVGPFIYRDVVAGTLYWFKCVSVSPFDIEGATPPTDSLTMVGVAAVGITSLTTTVSFKSIFLNWATVADTSVNKTEVWRANTNDRAGASLITSIFGTSYTDIITTYSTTRYYWVRNKNPNGVYSDWYPVGSTAGVSGTTEAEPGSYTPDTTPPGTPTGLDLSTGVAQSADGTEFSWIRATWTANGEADISHYEYRIKETGGNYIYGYVTANEALFQPVRGDIVHYVGIRAIDKSGNKSAFCTDSWQTSAKDAVLPAVPTSFAAASSFKTIFLTWVNPADKDLSHCNIYYNLSSVRGSASLLAKVKGTFYAHNVGGYGETIYYWIASEDWSGNVSATEAGPVNAAGAYIAAADIGSFAITASKIYTKIPIITGDTWTDNSPSAGYVAWNAHTLYYNGVAYSISASNTNLKYIYWLNTGTSYTKSDTNPVLTDGDFIVAVNISGSHDLAWNAIANQVIGSAYIQDAAIVNAKIGLLAVDDANINTLNASKINAGDIAAARMEVQGGNAINAGSVKINPGQILVSGATTLSDWRHGTDATKIDGGDVYANSITANKISLGSRNLTIQGIEIAAQTPPSSKESLLHFNGTNGATTFTDEYGWGWTAYGTAQLSTTSAKFGTAKLLLDGNSDYIKSLDFTSLGATFCIEGWFNTTDKTQQNQGILSFVNATNYGLDLRFNYDGNNKLTLWASSNGTSWDIASASAGANTTWSDATWYKFRVEFTGTRYSVYVGTAGMAEDIGVNSTGVICAITSAIIGANTTNYFYGGIDEFRVLIGRYRDGTTFTAETAELTEANYLFWSAGVISYIQDAGTTTDVAIAQGNVLWTTGTLYLYWVKDAAALSTTTTRATAFGAENIVLASYRGGSDMVVNYGRTIIDGSDIVTRTIKAEHLSVTELITTTAQIKNLQVTTIKIADNAVTIPVSAYTAGQIACPTSTETTVQSATITCTGNPIHIIWNFTCHNNYGSAISTIYYLYRDATELHQFGGYIVTGSSGYEHISRSMTDTPAAGTYTYYVKCDPLGGTAVGQWRSLILLETKK